MLRIYTFANALRLTKNIKYPLPEEEGYDINIVSLPAWVDLVQKYVKTRRHDYSTQDMLKAYVDGNIQLTYTVPELTVSMGDYTIYSPKTVPPIIGSQYLEIHGTNRVLQGFLKDYAVYERANSWFMAKGEELVAVDTLFYFEKMAAWYRRSFEDSETLQVFIDFCLDVMELWRVYRLTPSEETLCIPSDKQEIVGDYVRHIWER